MHEALMGMQRAVVNRACSTIYNNVSLAIETEVIVLTVHIFLPRS